ncbi:MAG: aldehyde dehydrogenase [Bdellovibrionaceae bacterium]|jgi:aminomuconate-semialdehyde/2-hydroxymuconate-6-semialdehyde dehydrogenase|nr:aldehyde dehydrogenase [Pseudobdellovibrionaceae bacterium]
MKIIKNFIHNEYVDAVSGKTLDNFNPATGKVYSQMVRSGEADVQTAVASAEKAFPLWSTSSRNDRSDMLMQIGALLQKRVQVFAEAESIDQGKPVSLALKVDMARAVKNFEFFAHAILHEKENCSKLDGVGLNYSLRSPVGVAGLISPWNLPLYLLTWKVAPALAVGNTAICKPSELTPMTAYMFSQVLKDVGLPPGVCNIIFGLGSEAGAAIVKHPKIPIISFTGGTQTAESIIKDSAPHFKKLGLELGGKNPNIIFNDCDLSKTVDVSVKSSFNNQGEICLCGSRIFVQKEIYPKFIKDFIEKTEALIVGDPWDAQTFMGALVSKEHRDKVMSYINLAESEGGKLISGGKVPVSIKGTDFENGYFIEPTIIEAQNIQCRLLQEEVFGPVVTITQFTDEDEVISWANSTKYGLSASVWTQDITRAHSVAERIKSGTVWINSWMIRDLRVPFGGMKASGMGREGGSHSIDFYTELKNVFVSY